jgi:hypothetical protein
MQVKLLMTWDIKPGLDQEYFEFMVREWVPGITRLGLEPTESWFAVYGECPQIMNGGIANDLPSMRNILESDDWQQLHDQLMQFVDNYEHKVVRATGYFQL